MIIGDLFYKIKEDFKSLRKYPDVESEGSFFSVNYDKYWKKRGRSNVEPILSDWQKKRVDIILGELEENSEILDVGCGEGAVLKYFKDKIGSKGIGVDISEKILEKAKINGVQTIKMDVTDTNKIKSLPEVDYVIGFEILEHMPNPESVVSELAKKTRKAMFFSVPNTGYYAHRLRLLFGKFPLQWASHPGEHLRFWTVSDIRWWLKELGFNLVFLKLYEGLPLLNKIFPSLFSQGIIIKISKD
ncbi:class I SAM-dependent methyltransferase [Patescibacteria group bacterium]|nr:class I SAM-dependent methyltransferase [Patescibacteria group bacterium]